MDFSVVYVPAGVGTFDMEEAKRAFDASVHCLKSLEPDVICPGEMLLSVQAVESYLASCPPADLLIFQNLSFANSAYISAAMHERRCPVVLWALREPPALGGRLKLNSLTGAFSAGNALSSAGAVPYAFVYGSPEEACVRRSLDDQLRAARLKKELSRLRLAAIGDPPEGFGFGSASAAEMENVFGVTMLFAETRALMEKARALPPSAEEHAFAALPALADLERFPEGNRRDFLRLLAAYRAYIEENRIGALASRCWPDFFTCYGTPVCAVLSLLNDLGVSAACEADILGALSMWIGQRLSGAPVFFGDPVAMDEAENTLTFWHCGMAPCALAEPGEGPCLGVHPNRKIGPVMDFGCREAPVVTVFRVGRLPGGGFRFTLFLGEALQKPKQYTGTSAVVRVRGQVKELVRRAVEEGMEPHFAVIYANEAAPITALAKMLSIPVTEL